MLRSLLNSARGRSAVNTVAPSLFRYPSFGPPGADRPESLPIPPTVARPATMPPARPALSLPGSTTTALATRDAPRNCCVHCGHPLFVPPKVLRIRCPKCSTELPAQDVVLTGEVHEGQILTSGRIIVAADARVSAQLVACSVEIAGMVLGTVLASHTCRLLPTAKLAGSLLCRRLAMDSGAQLEGSVELIRT